MPRLKQPAARGWNPLGISIWDYARGDTQATVTVLRGDGAVYPMPARLFFRQPRQFSAMERMALRQCKGRVLDIGAGAGCHTLALQKRGLEVVALDSSGEAVRVMRERGVRDPRVANGLAASGGPYDTLLMMMNGIAIVKSIAGLRRFLRHCRRLLTPQGQLLFDSLDIRQDDLSRRFARNRKATTHRYFGEMLFRMHYKGRTGRRFQLLFIDPARLAREAALAGWRAQVLFDEGEGRYLARLVPIAQSRGQPSGKPSQPQSKRAAG